MLPIQIHSCALACFSHLLLPGFGIHTDVDRLVEAVAVECLKASSKNIGTDKFFLYTAARGLKVKVHG